MRRIWGTLGSTALVLTLSMGGVALAQKTAQPGGSVDQTPPGSSANPTDTQGNPADINRGSSTGTSPSERPGSAMPEGGMQQGGLYVQIADAQSILFDEIPARARRRAYEPLARAPASAKGRMPAAGLIGEARMAEPSSDSNRAEHDLRHPDCSPAMHSVQ